MKITKTKIIILYDYMPIIKKNRFMFFCTMLVRRD